MKAAILAALLGAALAAPARADLKFEGSARFGALYDGASGTTVTTSRLRLTLDGETATDGGLEFSFRLRFQSDDGTPAGFNAARFGVRSGPVRLQIGNVGGAIDTMPGLSGAEPGLTDLTGQTAALRAGYDEYDNTGAGRNGVILRYAQGPVRLAISHSKARGIRRTAAHLAYTSGPGTLAIGYQISDRAADDGLVVVVYSHTFGWGRAGLLAARERAGNVLGASARLTLSARTALLAAASAGRGRRYYGLGIEHDLGGGAAFEAGIARVRGRVKADFGLRYEF